MSIVKSQNIAGGGGGAAAAGARKIAFATARVGEVRSVKSLASASYAKDRAAKEDLTLSPEPHVGVAANTTKSGGGFGGEDGGLGFFKLADFASQYGPAGFNTLSDTDMTMLTSFANAVKAGKTGYGGGAGNMISNFMKTHASAYAGRSSIDKTTDGNDIPNSSGGASMGWSDAAEYGVGSSAGEPVKVSPATEPPSINPMLTAATVDLPSPPVEDEGSPLERGEGTATVDKVVATTLSPLEMGEGTSTASLATSDGAVTVDPMPGRRAAIQEFLASPAGRDAFSDYMMASKSGYQR